MYCKHSTNTALTQRKTRREMRLLKAVRLLVNCLLRGRLSWPPLRCLLGSACYAQVGVPSPSALRLAFALYSLEQMGCLERLAWLKHHRPVKCAGSFLLLENNAFHFCVACRQPPNSAIYRCPGKQKQHNCFPSSNAP